MLAAAWPCLAVLALAPDRPEDQVVLKNGKTLSGLVVYEDAEVVVLLEGTREREISAPEVERVESTMRSLGTALDRLTEVKDDEPAGLLDLARYCQAHGLPGEAQALAWAVLAREPDHAEANGIVGNKKRGAEWTARVAGKSYRLGQLDQLRSDWKNAWEFETTHYRVRTNLPLLDGVRAILDLERIYRDVYNALAPELRLRDVTRPLNVQLHASSSSFPELLSGSRSYFATAQEILFVSAVGGVEVKTLVHEAVHQLLWACGPGRSAGVAELPAWLDEGLAEFFAWGAAGDPGRVRVSAGGLHQNAFRLQATSDDPYKLSRVLTFGGEDFRNSSKVELKYAQAYTLVHYCMHGDGGARRKGFFDFLRKCWEGKSSMTDFKSSIDLSERDFERAWVAYVAENV